jgi:hypothetical protein
VERLEIDGTTVVVRRRWLVLALTVWAIACIPAAALLAQSGMPLAVLPLTLVTAAIALAGRQWPHRLNGKVSIDGDVVRLGRRVVAKRGEITNAISSTRNGRGLVRLSRGWAGIDVELELAGEAEAKALLEGLRLDPAHRTAHLVASGGTPGEAARRSAIAVVVLSAIAVAPVFLGVVGLLSTAFAILATFIFAFRSFTTLTVGVDGVLVHRAFSRDRFIPYKEIETVRSDGGVLEIVTKGRDAPLRLHLGGLGSRLDRAVYGDDHEFRLRAFTERVSEAMRNRSDATPFAPERLARGGRPVSKWLRDLRGVDEETAGFRDNAVPPDVLLGVVENPAALPTARAGAAVALGARLDQDHAAGEGELRARLRVAADACASPALRVALTAAARVETDPDDERLVDALGRLDDDPPTLAAIPNTRG